MNSRCAGDLWCRAFAACLVIVGMGGLFLPASAQQVSLPTCGMDERGQWGRVQWDYRYATAAQRIEVEGAHFTPPVENLIKGRTAPIGADIHYVLGSVPNHHRALVATMRYSEKTKSDPPPYMAPLQCYFDRAMKFAPDDHVVRMIYAQFLIKKSREDEAIRQLDAAIRIAGPDDPIALYNVGLMYLEMKRYDLALDYAHKALAMGFDRPELRRGLEAAGRWVEPARAGAVVSASPPPPPPAASAAASASAVAPKLVD